MTRMSNYDEFKLYRCDYSFLADLSQSAKIARPSNNDQQHIIIEKRQTQKVWCI